MDIDDIYSIKQLFVIGGKEINTQNIFIEVANVVGANRRNFQAVNQTAFMEHAVHVGRVANQTSAKLF